MAPNVATHSEHGSNGKQGTPHNDASSSQRGVCVGIAVREEQKMNT